MRYQSTCIINLFQIGTSIGDKLKYFRTKHKLTQNELAEIIGFSNGSCIKDIELNKKLPGREISKKFASYFKLKTKYFYDEYLEETDNARDMLKHYREKHNLTVKQICLDINISETAWSSWESGKNYIGRDKYKLLKKYRIL